MADVDATVRLKYQWLCNNEEIQNANTQTYRVQLLDAGKGICCRVSVIRDAVEATSNFFEMSNTIVPLANHARTHLPLDENGFHDINAIINAPGKYEDGRIVYLDTADGNDQNAKLYHKHDPELATRPTTPANILAFRSPALAFGKLRSGYPDVLLIKRGTTFDFELRWKAKAGRSGDERQIVSCYGTAGDLPKTTQSVLKVYGGAGTAGSIDHLLVSHLCYYDAGADPDSVRFSSPDRTLDSVFILWPMSNILVEGVQSRFGMLNIQSQNGPVRGIILRRVNVTDTYSKVAHQQGIYTWNAGIELEECLFDHCGWNEKIEGAKATIFNHNLYLQQSDIEVDLRDSIVSNAASHGIQQRCGGENENNLYLDNPLHILVGGGTSPWPSGVRCSVQRNVLIGSGEIHDQERGFGIDVSNIRSGIVRQNVIAHQDSISDINDHSILLSEAKAGVGINDLEISDNLLWNWRGEIGVSIPPGQPNEINKYSKVSITGNYVFEAESQRQPILRFKYMPTLRCENNRLFLRSSRPWVTVSDKPFALHEFNKSVEQENFVWSDYDRFAVPTVSDYLHFIGESRDKRAFLDRCRLQTFINWDGRFTASAFNAFVRARVNLDVLCPKD